MAITISSQPTAYESAYNDNTYVMTSDDGTLEKISATVTYDSVDYIIYADLIDSKFTFNLSNILKSFIISKDPLPSSTSTSYPYVITYSVLFTEIKTSGDTSNVTGKKVSFNIETEYSLTTAEILTPSGLYPALNYYYGKVIRNDYTLYFSYFIDTGITLHTVMEIFLNDGTSSITQTGSSITISADSLYTNLFSLTNGLRTSIFGGSCKYVEVWIRNDSTLAQLSEKIRLYPDLTCGNYNNIIWLNQYNSTDNHSFKLKNNEGISRDESGYIIDNSFNQSLLKINDTKNLGSFDENYDTLIYLGEIWKARTVWFENVYDSQATLGSDVFKVEVTNSYSLGKQDRTINLVFKMPEEIYD